MVSEVTIKKEKLADEWEKLKVKDLVTFSGGSQPPRNTFIYSDKKGHIRLIQIRDYKTDNFKTYIPKEMAQKTCDEDDVMIGRYGPPIFQILRGIKGAYNVALIKAIPSNKIINDYLYYFLKQKKLFYFIEKLSRRSSGQTGVDLVALNEYPFPLPKKEEQQKIATALSDMDDLIESLEKIIEKKKKIKQGTMQQLLTGKKRLSGFDGEWKVVKVEDFGSIITGGTPSTKNKEYWNGDFPWVTPTDIMGRKDILKTDRMITQKGIELINRLPSRTVLVTCIASIGKNAILMQDGACNQQINAIIPNNKYNSDFLYYLMENNKGYLMSKAGITATNIISKQVFSEIAFLVPKFKEQQAIAEILSDMDAEIDHLEQKLEKYKKLKEGMMQELLTGRIRLV